ncbi:hypothetical protein [Chryseolinea lacunae]|uniref:Outer membrane protein beta-barrel domain-containing protein n=1 Tax=Chryseolinea lacunae TaxID=2801331 RepID=A0ABS1L2B9_9BACT|nr:hypothetical protein [Chryseolinea lacunae]MBL0745825.1 hypothetical protein [Chryseolinea lacunae]
MKTTKNPGKSLTIVFSIFLAMITVNVMAQYNGTGFTRPRRPYYFGYEIGVGVQHQMLHEAMQSKDQMCAISGGLTLGVKLANRRAALRPHVGIYYAGGSGTYSLDVLEAGTTGQLYFLRLGQIKNHGLEPYALASVFYQRTAFCAAESSTTQTNYSVSNESKLGAVRWANGSVGLGVEYQLENDDYQFLHFFLEARYGMPFMVTGSNQDFTKTSANNLINVAFGVALGKIR